MENVQPSKAVTKKEKAPTGRTERNFEPGVDVGGWTVSRAWRLPPCGAQGSAYSISNRTKINSSAQKHSLTSHP